MGNTNNILKLIDHKADNSIAGINQYTLEFENTVSNQENYQRLDQETKDSFKKAIVTDAIKVLEDYSLVEFFIREDDIKLSDTIKRARDHFINAYKEKSNNIVNIFQQNNIKDGVKAYIYIMSGLSHNYISALYDKYYKYLLSKSKKYQYFFEKYKQEYSDKNYSNLNQEDPILAMNEVAAIWDILNNWHLSLTHYIENRSIAGFSNIANLIANKYVEYLKDLGDINEDKQLKLILSEKEDREKYYKLYTKDSESKELNDIILDKDKKLLYDSILYNYLLAYKGEEALKLVVQNLKFNINNSWEMLRYDLNIESEIKKQIQGYIDLHDNELDKVISTMCKAYIYDYVKENNKEYRDVFVNNMSDAVKDEIKKFTTTSSEYKCKGKEIDTTSELTIGSKRKLESFGDQLGNTSKKRRI